MTTNPPDFFDLVGDDGTPEELEQLRRAHDLLIAAGPPAELPPRLREAPTATGKQSSSWLPRRRRRSGAFILAAGFAAAAFAVGYLVGNRGSDQFQSIGRPIPMHATEQGSGRASILIGDRDAVGNWPLLVSVRGLKQLPEGQWYELYLTRKGKLAAYCGAFSVKGVGQTSVRLSVPYSFKGFDGWVVTTSKQEVPRQVLLTT